MPGNGVSQGQELPRGYERGRWTLDASYQPRGSCTQGGDILGIEEQLAATRPICGAADVNTRHALLCHRAGARVNQRQPLIYATSRFLKRMSVRQQVESSALFHTNRDLRVDIVIEGGGLRSASASDFRHTRILIDVAWAGPQSGVHLRVGSADQDRPAASTSEARKRNYYAGVGHVSFDERSHKLISLAVENVGRIEREGSEFIDQLATSVDGGRDGKAMAKKGICKGRHLQIVPVASQIAISCRVHRCKLAFYGVVERYGREEGRGGRADADGVGLAHVDAEWEFVRTEEVY